MPMKRCTLRGDTVRTVGEFYDHLGNQLALPRHFGRNLDALYDVLSTDIPGPVEITWLGAVRSERAMGEAEFSRIVGVLKQIEFEREDFRLRLS